MKGSLMDEVNVTEFRTNLSAYLARVQRGEEIRLIRRGRIVAVLTAPGDQSEDARRKLRQLQKTARVGEVDTPLNIKWDAD